MPIIAWIVVPLTVLVVVAIIVVAIRPSSAPAVARVLLASAEPLRVLVPWLTDSGSVQDRRESEAE